MAKSIMKKINMFFKNNLFSKKYNALLTVVGVGPGDPDYLTLAAIKAIRKSKIIFYPISGFDNESFSLKIVKKYSRFKKKIPIIFPMGRRDYDPKEVWKRAAEIIVKKTTRNKKVVLLCLGDISIFASSSYIINEIKENYPKVKINLIPGISSVSLAAALGDFQLINQGETLEILECPDNFDDLINSIENKNNCVLAIMKVGKRWQSVKKVLKANNILDKAVLAVNLGMENQFIDKAYKNNSDEIPYFSLLLIRI